MADDVKVKFSGDFSDVPKGASEAASRAGSAMKSWAGDFGKSLAGSFVGLFAADAVLGAIKDFASGVREQLTYFKELSHVIEKTNVDAKEFQQLAAYARENGVAMETLGRGMAFANVYLGKVKDGTKAARDELRALKFTEDEINSGRVNSIKILMRLADAYQIEGQQAQVAEHLKKVFGKGGIELLPMMREGSAAIQERMDETKPYSEYEIKAAANLARFMDRMERKKKEAEKKTAIFAGVSEQQYEMQEPTAEAIKEIRRRHKMTRPEAIEYIKSSKEAADEYATIFKEKLKEAKINPEMAVLAQAANVAKLEKAEEGRLEPSSALISARRLLDALVSSQEKKEGVKLGPETAENESVAALTASSLQSIGGGDIASVLAGTSPMDQTAENTRQANIYLKTIAEKQPVEQVDGTAAH